VLLTGEFFENVQSERSITIRCVQLVSDRLQMLDKHTTTNISQQHRTMCSRIDMQSHTGRSNRFPFKAIRNPRLGLELGFDL